MPITRHQYKAATGLRLLTRLPPEINFLIYDQLDEHNTGKPIPFITQSKGPGWCYYCDRREDADLFRPWSPWTLTQISKELHNHWRPYYSDRTKLAVCIHQLKDYVDTFVRENERRTPTCRQGSPVSSLAVYISSQSIRETSLHVLFEAMELLPTTYLVAPLARLKPHCVTVIQKMVKLSREDFMRELLPNVRGDGKLKSLYLDRDLNLWLDPQPGYLSAFPALDPALCNSLYELWNSVPVCYILFQVIPTSEIDPEERACKAMTPPSDRRLDVRHQFWQRFPHQSHIHSIHCLPGYYDFVIQPCPFVLPEGYNITEIGFNEKELCEGTDRGMWVEMVAPGDDEFHIQTKGPGEYLWEHTDEDFAGDVETIEDHHCSDGGSDKGDDKYPQEGHEEMPDIACCLEDMNMPLQDLLDDVYAGYGVGSQA